MEYKHIALQEATDVIVAANTATNVDAEIPGCSVKSQKSRTTDQGGGNDSHTLDVVSLDRCLLHRRLHYQDQGHHRVITTKAAKVHVVDI